MKKELLNLKKGLFIAAMSTSLTTLAGCGIKDTRIDDIEKYYLLRTIDESGTQADIVYVYPSNTVGGSNVRDGYIYSYAENYYEYGKYHSINKNFSPIQFIPYADVIKKETYYKSNVQNNDENLKYISNVLETYAFPTHVNYTFGETSYEYQCHIYEIENKLTQEKRYAIGYPLIKEESSPTQIYDALTASFIYLQTSEYATAIPSELDEMESFTLGEGHAILDKIIAENKDMTRTLTPDTDTDIDEDNN